jgi:hypothetical protein
MDSFSWRLTYPNIQSPKHTLPSFQNPCLRGQLHFGKKKKGVAEGEFVMLAVMKNRCWIFDKVLSNELGT